LPFCCIACPPQIPKRLRSGAAGYPYRSQISGSMTAARFEAFRRFLLIWSPALTGSSVGAITSTIAISCSEDREQPDNSQLSPDKYEVLDGEGELSASWAHRGIVGGCKLSVRRDWMTHTRSSSISTLLNRHTEVEVDDAEFRPGKLLAEPLIDSVKAAAIVGIHPKTLQRYARCSVIPGIQIGGRWRFRASVIDAWISRKYPN